MLGLLAHDSRSAPVAELVGPVVGLVDKVELEFLAGEFGEVDGECPPAFRAGFFRDHLVGHALAVAEDEQSPVAAMDSLMAIVSEAGVNADQYLKENQRNTETATIAAGGWIEAMYIISNIADKSQNKDIIGLVGDQKIVLKNLMNMLEQFQNDEDIKSVLSDMRDIAVTYETIQASQSTPLTSDKDIISVGSNTSFVVSKEQLKSILEKVTSLRNKITL